jgi:hypothetical protein
MLKFLDKPVTWKSWILLSLALTVGHAAAKAAREYQLNKFSHDYFDIEEDNM